MNELSQHAHSDILIDIPYIYRWIHTHIVYKGSLYQEKR